MRICALLAAVFVSAPALAVPTTFTHQGYIADQTGGPLQGQQDVTFTIYDAPASGAVLWTETLTLDFEDGVYSTSLGEVTTLDPAEFAANEDWFLGIAVGTSPELPGRAQLVSVPYAFVAEHAGTATAVAGGGVVDASEIQVNGSTVIDSSGNIDWSSISNAPPDTLAALGCGATQIAVFDGAVWSCGDASAHAHDASQIATGTIDIGRLPIGNGANEAAPGDHLHTASDTTSGVFGAALIPDLDAAKIATGTLSFALLPVGTGATEIAAGDHNHDTAYLQLSDLSAADAGTLTGGGDASTLHTHAAEPNPWVACGDLGDFAANSCTIAAFPPDEYEYGFKYNTQEVQSAKCTFWNAGQRLYNRWPYLTYADNPDNGMRWGGAMFYRNTSASSDDGCNGTTQWRHAYWSMNSVGAVSIDGSNGCTTRPIFCRERR